jgi:hypothetical protein
MANQFDLTELFKAIHSAVDEAADVNREAATRWVHNFFDEHEDGTLSPKLITMKLPVLEAGQFVEKETHIPLFSLANHQSLGLEKLDISFEIDLHTYDDGKAIVSTSSKWFGGSTKAKIEMSFKGEKPSEGVMKINDSLVKTIPG